MKSMLFTSMIIFHYFLLPIFAIPTIVTRLIHYQSVSSPVVLQSNYSDLEISVARIMQLGDRMPLGKLSYAHFDTGIFTKKELSLFLLEVNIGQEMHGGSGFRQMVAIDTGSSLLSVKCNDDDEYGDGTDSSFSFYNSYEPTLSYTNSPTDCELCEEPLTCEETINRCYFSQHYITARESGFLASDQFIFNSSLHEESGITISNITFGCSFSIPGLNSKLNGILGLGTSKFSLLSQILATEFSYCVGNFQSPSSTGNVLMIGPNEYFNDFIEIENSTPFSSNKLFYQVNLTGISFGQMIFDVDKEQPSDLGNTIFDLGASLTLLQPIVYKELYDAISDWMVDTPMQLVDSKLPELCYRYRGSLQKILEDFPLVSFHFSGGATLDLDVRNIFRREGLTSSFENLACLNVINAQDYFSKGYPYNIIGAYLQQYHYMKYDLVNRRIHMTSMNCESLV